MKLQIVIDKKGQVTIENEETVGPGCTGIADKLAAALGQKQEQELKQEYYELPLPDYAEVKE
jgi:hypothetical protein